MKLICFSDLEAVRIACSDWNHTSSVCGNRITEEFASQRIREMEIGQRYALSSIKIRNSKQSGNIKDEHVSRQWRYSRIS